MTTATMPGSTDNPDEGRVSERQPLLKVEAHNDNHAPAERQASAWEPGAEDRFDFTGLADDERAFEDETT